MTSRRCQACHRDPFHSFATDHPEFKNYPYDRMKNIEFDHVKHRDLHFSKKEVNFDCKACHVQADQVGAVGQVFRSVSFEQACASCHTEPIKSAMQDGLIVNTTTSNQTPTTSDQPPITGDPYRRPDVAPAAREAVL